MRTTAGNPRALTVALLTLLALAGTGLLVSSNGRATAAPATDQFAVLDRAVSSADSAGDRPVSVARLKQDMPQLVEASARAVRRTKQATTVLTDRSDGSLCLSTASETGFAAISCVDRPKAESEGIVIDQPGAGFGVVPNGVQKVLFTMADGTSRSGSVSTNAFEAPSEATAVSYVIRGQKVTHDLTAASEVPKGVIVDR